MKVRSWSSKISTLISAWRYKESKRVIVSICDLIEETDRVIIKFNSREFWRDRGKKRVK